MGLKQNLPGQDEKTLCLGDFEGMSGSKKVCLYGYKAFSQVYLGPSAHVEFRSLLYHLWLGRLEAKVLRSKQSL